MRHNIEKSKRMPKGKEVEMKEMTTTKPRAKRMEPTEVELDVIRGAENIMERVRELIEDEKFSQAHRALEKGLKNLSTAITNQMKGDTHPDLHRVHKEMTKMLGRLTSKVKVQLMGKSQGHELVHAERNRSKTAHKMDAKAVVRGFIDSLDKQGKEPGVKVLVSKMEKISREFLKHGNLKQYKKDCNEALEEHKKKYYKVHHRQPKGVFEHITNAVRAMFRLLEKMVNYVFGTNNSMFKKANSPLGKLVKDFQAELKDLAEYKKEQGNTHRP